MALRPVHVLLLVLPLFGYLFYRAAATEAKVHNLERRLEALDRPLAARVPAASPGTSGGPGAASPAGPPELTGLRDEVRSLKEEVAKVRQVQEEVGTPDAILDVVEEEQLRVRNLMVDFHSERWHEAAEAALTRLVHRAKLTDAQRKRLGSAMADEVDSLAQLARAPGALQDPDKLANDVMQLRDETTTRALGFLNPAQRGAWEAHRARERRIMYPWLPH